MFEEVNVVVVERVFFSFRQQGKMEMGEEHVSMGNARKRIVMAMRI